MAKRKYSRDAKCPQCGREFTATNGQAYLIRKGRPVYCPGGECHKAAKSEPRPDRVGIPLAKRPLLERFLERVKRLPNGCLECDLSRNSKGYPTMKVEGRNRLAHHVAWFLHYGEWPPPGMELDHICHVPHGLNRCDGGIACPHRRCVEWSHLKLVAAHGENNSTERSAAGRINSARFAAARAGLKVTRWQP